jgi:hypothetical protein
MTQKMRKLLVKKVFLYRFFLDFVSEEKNHQLNTRVVLLNIFLNIWLHLCRNREASGKGTHFRCTYYPLSLVQMENPCMVPRFR